MFKQVITETHDSEPQLWLQAIVHDADTKAYFLVLQFRNVQGSEGTVRVDRALMREPSKVFSLLLSAGALLPETRAQALEFVNAALHAEPVEQYSITCRGGWHGSSFVTPVETFGPQAGKLKFAGSTTTDPSYGMRKGTLDDWKAALQLGCAASSLMTFTLATGYGAPLLQPMGEGEGAIFNLHSASSSGKSLVSRVLESLGGRAQKADLATFDVTDRAIEELCFARNDATVVFDEEGRNTGGNARGKDRRRKIAFMVPGGRGTLRSQRAANSSDLANLNWRLFGISSSEEPLETAEAPRRAGEQVRHIDIAVPHPKHGGIFDLIDEEGPQRTQEAIGLAASVEQAIDLNYGVGQAGYLTALMENRGGLEQKLHERVNEFIAYVKADTDPWERRFALKFAIPATGAMLAAEWGVAPFDEDHAYRCAISVYRRARKSVFSVEEVYTSVIAKLRRVIADESRVPRLEKGETLPRKLRDEAWGFRRSAKKGDFVALDPTRFENLVGSPPTAEAVLDLMIDRGVALKGRDGKRRPQIAVQGFDRDGRSRWVCLRGSAF